MKAIVLLVLLVLTGTSIYAANDQQIQLNSRYLALTFSGKSGSLSKMIKSGQAVVTNDEELSLWEINLVDKQGQKVKIESHQLKKFAVNRTGTEQIELIWSGAELPKLTEISVRATVSLAQGDSLSYWSLNLSGLGTYAIENVTYPIIGGIQNNEKSLASVPNWMGHLYENPGGILKSMKKPAFQWIYPGQLSMQFISIYQPGQNGFYVASDDAHAFQKDFKLGLSNQSKMVFQMMNYPEFKFGIERYTIPYKTVVGGFKGDWFTAAEIYRNWGTKQEWATKARLSNNQVPDWLKQTGLWVWNRGRTTEVLDPATAIQQKVKLPVSVLWHWWHGSSYDDSFPEYIPPRDGKDLFMKDLHKAQSSKINAIVYMNQMQWSRSTKSWDSEGAIKNAAKNRDGSTTDHVFNIFSGKSLTNMCLAASSWRDKYTGLADTVINSYGVNGIYMDQACLSRMCFDTTHGHPLGGGNYWAQGAGKLTMQIRDRVNASDRNKITLSGEGVSEAWLPHLDAFLALQVSLERYSGAGYALPIPLFQAVYHSHAVIYGNYSSLLKPPYDEKWPAEQKPTDALTLLDAKYNQQFLMEQGRSFAWGMQPMLSNYLPSLDTDRKKEMGYLYELVKIRNQAKEYLLHGKMMQNIRLDIPVQKMSISKLSIYAGQKEKVTNYEKAYPTVYTGVWLSDKKNLGIALTNIATTDYQAVIRFDLNQYGLTGKRGTIYQITALGKSKLGSFTNGKVDKAIKLSATSSLFLEIQPQ